MQETMKAIAPPHSDGRAKEAPPFPATIRVSIVEDDDWLRDNLAAALEAAPGLSCLSRFGSAEEALAVLPTALPDVVLMDIGAQMNGVECVRHKNAASSVQVPC